MALTGSVWTVFCFVFILMLTISDVTGVHGQNAKSENQIPSNRGLESIMALGGNGMDLGNIVSSVNQALVPGTQQDSSNTGQNMDLSSIIHLANALQRGVGSPGLLSQFHDANSYERSNNRAEVPPIEVFVETKSVDDLLASDAGRRQIGQLNAELKDTMDSFYQGIHLKQHFHQTENMLGDMKANNAVRQQRGQSNAQMEQVFNFFKQGGRIEQQFKEADQMLKSLTANGMGKQETGQLNVQLEHAMNSLNNGVHMEQQMKLAQQTVEGLQTSDAVSALGGIVRMLTGEGTWEEMLQGFTGRDSLQAVDQLREAMNQLPALRGVADTVYQLFQKTEPSTSRNIQLLLAAFDSSLSKKSMPGTESIRRMVDLAIVSLKDNVEMLNSAVHKALQVTRSPTFVQAAKDIQCSTKSLIGESKDSGIAVQCMSGLMQSVSNLDNSEQMVAAFTESMTTLLNNPPLLQSFLAMLKSTNLNTAFTLMQTAMGNFSTANENLRASVQTFQGMMRGLFEDQHVIEEIKNLMRSLDTSSVWEYSMILLKNATDGDPASQQLLVTFNDTIVSAWNGIGDPQQAVDNLKEVVVTLNNTQDPSQPVSQTQQTFLNNLVRFMEVVVDAFKEPDQGTTQLPGYITTAKPIVSTTLKVVNTTITTSKSVDTTPVSTTSVTTHKSVDTTPISTTNTQPSMSVGTSTIRAESSTSAPTRITFSTTTREQENDDATEDKNNGEAHISWSGICMLVSLCVFKTLF